MAGMHNQTMAAYSPAQEGQPPTVVVVPPAGLKEKLESYPCKAAIILGACQITLGILIIVTEVVNWDGMAIPVAFSILVIVAGVFEVTSGKSNTRSWIITTMVCAIVAAVFAVAVIALGAEEADNACVVTYIYSKRSEGLRDPKMCIASGFYTFFACVEFIIAIAAAALTCQPVCCTPDPLQQGVIVSPQIATQTGQQAALEPPPAYSYQSADGPPPSYQSCATATYPPVQPEETKKVPPE